MVVKYTDNIMKGFSAAAAIVLSTVASVLLFGLQISECFSLVFSPVSLQDPSVYEARVCRPVRSC